ncbi:MAG: FAD/FMN-containing dehydrogenase, partial [Campylobacterales bacterium]
MKTLFALITLAASLFAGIPAGNAFPATTLEDQFEKRHSVSAEDRIVLVSFERDVSNAVNAFLQKQPKGFLKVHNAKYIADISAMPTIVSKLFALPKMRDYHYPVLLNYDDGFEKRFDKKEGKLTVYRLQAGMVVSVEFVDG